MLRGRASARPRERAFTFLPDGECQEVSLSYAALDWRARAIALRLRQAGAQGTRALLLYPPGLDYIEALFGCFYAGVVAVPAYPPDPRRLNRTLPRLQAIVMDAEADFALTTTAILSVLDDVLANAPDLKAMRWLATDDVDGGSAAAWEDGPIRGDALALLQYTSGSTAAPRGVMLSHGNLVHNAALIEHECELYGECSGAGWLPPYHDMGLMGIIVQPVFSGFPMTLMSPVDFLRRPLRWLEALSRYRATFTGAPNFAYELCVNKTSPAERATLDLRCLEVAGCGAEPVRSETLDRFARAFEPCGFRRRAFYPCYGLAEATLIVSGGHKGDEPVVRRFRATALEKHRAEPLDVAGPDARTLVGCGRALWDEKIVIVNPDSLTVCVAEEVGEIWVSGPSVGHGYWRQPSETERTFGARLASGEGPFLRTGDLGFFHDGELFITGRLKDLIIVRGRTLYPQDIEQTIEGRDPVFRPGCNAAFSIEAWGSERLVVVQEVDLRHCPDTRELIGRIREAVAEAHDAQPHAVVLVAPRSIPKTSSGKIQRRACRDDYVAGRLEVVAAWHATPPIHALRSWLVSALSAALGVAGEEIEPDMPLARYGLDSAKALTAVSELEAWLGRPLSAALFYDYPTIETLARYLSEAAGSDDAPWPASFSASTAEPIAIIGIGCRFPGASGPGDYWRLLCDGRDAVTEVPADRWDAQAFYDPDPTAPARMNTRWGGFLDAIDQFDPQFFGISRREAARMDPQQRLLLQVAWEALEDAGQAAETLVGSRVGVFVGISTNDYGQLQLSDPAVSDPYVGTGNALSIAANRISYSLGFTGPSMAIDTACSSSLVAVHLACQSLARRESTLALAGGANLILSPVVTLNLAKAGFMAPDGRCKAFDARADGYVRGEGVGIVVLKPLSAAQADGDPIYAVIAGSAVNQDGRSNDLTAPNRHAQEALLREAYARAGRAPKDVQYVEAHGTGTALGDVIEATALGNVLGADRAPGRPCAIGSVKTNVGHLEAAAGIASVIKVALALTHRMIPPRLHFTEPNPQIPVEALRLRISTALEPWPEGTEPAVAGVSAFGFGGTNAHVVLEEPPAAPEPVAEDLPAADTRMLLPLSGRSPTALRTVASTYAAYLSSHPGVGLGDLCYSASVRRSHHNHRVALEFRSGDELQPLLLAVADGKMAGTKAGQPKLAFVIAGDEAFPEPLRRELCEREPVLRAALLRCHEALDEEQACAGPTPLAFATALAILWQSWGIRASALLVQCIEERTAARIAELLRIEDVRSAEAVGGLRREGYDVFLELSPSPILSSVLAADAGTCEGARVLSALRLDADPPAGMVETLGALYQLGCAVNWRARYGRPHRFLRLPSYPWENRRCWLPLRNRDRHEARLAHPVLWSKLDSPAIAGIVFAGEIGTDLQPFLLEHQQSGTVVVPLALYLELAQAAARASWGADAPVVLEDVEVRRTLTLTEGETRAVQVVLGPEEAGATSFAVYTAPVGKTESRHRRAWQRHATGQMRIAVDGTTSVSRERLTAAREHCTDQLPIGQLYGLLARSGLHVGSSFRGLEGLWLGTGAQALGRLRLPASIAREARAYELHPAFLDACLQTAQAVVARLTAVAGAACYRAMGVERLQLRAPTPVELWCLAQARQNGAPHEGPLRVDLTVLNGSGDPVGQIAGLRLVPDPCEERPMPERDQHASGN